MFFPVGHAIRKLRIATVKHATAGLCCKMFCSCCLTSAAAVTLNKVEIIFKSDVACAMRHLGLYHAKEESGAKF